MPLTVTRHTIAAPTAGGRNWGADYVIPELQAGIARYHGHPAGMNGMQRACQPTGRLQIPMVARAIAWDVIAPTFHKDSLRSAVDRGRREAVVCPDHDPGIAVKPCRSRLEEIMSYAYQRAFPLAADTAACPPCHIAFV